MPSDVKAELFVDESQTQNLGAICFDEKGRLYIAELHRWRGRGRGNPERAMSPFRWLVVKKSKNTMKLDRPPRKITLLDVATHTTWNDKKRGL